ncbi:MAG: hypothetical protein IPI46_03945 [Bacteroidetes bacterium]|nr:hypothetical protein [Bacteroidota bacterium]
MKRNHLLILTNILLIFCSCSKHIYVNYQTETANTGKVTIKPTKPTDKTYVTINDSLIVDKKNVKSVTITNLPIGDFNIHYTSDNSWYKDKLDTRISVKMEGSKEITKLVEVPPYSTGYWIYITGIAIMPPLISSIGLLLP